MALAFIDGYNPELGQVLNRVGLAAFRWLVWLGLVDGIDDVLEVGALGRFVGQRRVGRYWRLHQKTCPHICEAHIFASFFLHDRRWIFFSPPILNGFSKSRKVIFSTIISFSSDLRCCFGLAVTWEPSSPQRPASMLTSRIPQRP